MAEAVERRGAHKQPPPPVESLDLRQRERRDRIVQATVQLMGDHDYESLQMKDITAAAGVALGTTYRYFSSKDHLVAEALLAWSEQFKRESDVPHRPQRRPVEDRLSQSGPRVRALPVHLRPHARGPGVDRSARHGGVRAFRRATARRVRQLRHAGAVAAPRPGRSR